jgi:hypothetical protein
MRRALTLLLFAVAAPAALAEITISTITPAAGLVSGGEIVHIHGTNLGEPPVACAPLYCGLTVTLGNSRATIIWDAADEITVIAPPHAAGAVDVVVQVAGSLPVTIANGFSYQDPKSDVVKLLLPIATSAAGAFNTSWQTDVLVHNESNDSLILAGATVPPMASKQLSLSPPSTGMFLEIPRSLFEGVTVSTHVHDTIHDANTLGVDIPSVPETQFRRSIVLTGVPNDARYRVLLRVYGYGNNSAAIVRARDDSTGFLLDQKTAPMAGSAPAYVQVPIVADATSQKIRVEVTVPNTTDPPIWAFITLTNNVTESVTTITPSAGVAPAAPPAATLALGHWGRGGICMNVSASVVNINAGCVGGNFPTPLIDPDGHFEADGTYTPIPGAPPPQPILPIPAHFSGFVSGSEVTLTIRNASGLTLGPVTLQLGSTDPCLPPCP